MSTENSAIDTSSGPLSRLGSSGIAFGVLGVLAFSFTVPFTRIAVEGLHPLFVGTARAVVAGVLAAIALLVTRSRAPRGTQWARLAVIALGIVAGFPVLTSLALQTTTAGHSAVIIGLLPAVTASVVVIRTGERPGRRFWTFSAVGAVAVVGYSLAAHGALSAPTIGDLYLLGAVVLAAIGYAEGGLMAREIGAWQTISWALVAALPVMTTATAIEWIVDPPRATSGQWAAFAYLGVVSMFLGFFAWYRGLALGPMTAVSQVQLVQPVLSLVWSAALLGEPVTAAMIVGGAVIIGCARGAVRSRSRTTGSVNPVAPHRTAAIPRSHPLPVSR
ncbi:DMT family transporter [Williamsia herbipolensis]|uniref:DMT family transporter n=1 Tax=Williamsia herbipolensis TaxID=1603258 RepID=UPI0005F76618|nr:DMT family transporter [Williamsia herbipolensis]